MQNTIGSVSVNLPTKVVAEVLTMFRREYAECMANAGILMREIDKLRLHLEGEPQAMLAIPPIVAPPKRNAGGRLAKGELDRILAELLRAKNGSGMRMKLIMSEARCGATSAYRSLQRLQEANRVEKRDGIWHWRGTD